MKADLLCKKCQREIDPEKRADSIYCSDECRADSRVQELRRRNSERLLYERSIPQRFAAWMEGFERQLRKHAPENAVGYQAGLWSGRAYLWFPMIPAGTDARGRRRTRLDFYRRRTADEYFHVRPFEPPVVPLATLYKIRFISCVYPYPDLGDAGSFDEVIPYQIKIGGLPIDNLSGLPVRRLRKQ